MQGARTMKRVYVAGSYSADNVIDVLKNIGRGEKEAAWFFKMGFYPFCPWHDASYVKTFPDHDFRVSDFQKHSMAWLEVSDCVFVLPNFQSSKGTLAEIERAKELNIPVYLDIADFIAENMRS